MLRLMLLRHAKASWDEPSLPDDKRPLTERGRADAGIMGKLIAEQGLAPGLVLCSPARRAQQTLDIAMPDWSPQPDVRTVPALYGAMNDGYIETIRTLGEGGRLMLVGHNPAIDATARTLAGEGAEDVLARLQGGFKPGALAVIDFDIATWSAIRPKTGTLIAFLTAW